MRGVKSHDGLHRHGVPYVNLGVHVYFSSSDESAERVPCDTGDLQRVSLVELLYVLTRVVQDRKPRRKVNNILLALDMVSVVFDLLSWVQHIFIVLPEDLGQHLVQTSILLPRESQRLGDRLALITSLGEILSSCSKGICLVGTGAEMHVLHSVSTIRDLSSIDVIKDQSCCRRSLPNGLLELKVELGQQLIDAGGVRTPDQHGIILFDFLIDGLLLEAEVQLVD